MSSFDVKSKEWDTVDKVDRNNKLASIIKEEIDLTKIESVLEFGCGTGQLGLNFVEEIANVTFLDSSSGMLGVLKDKIVKLRVNNAKVCEEDILNHTGKYDLIISSMVFHHIDDVDSLIIKLKSLLNDDGVICTIDLNENEKFHSDRGITTAHGFKQEELVKKFVASGFEDVYSKDIFEGTRKNRNNGNESKYSLFMLNTRKV